MSMLNLRRIGWAAVLAICVAAWLALTMRVNSVKSDVRLAERRIVALQEETMLLETEFETRANQAQLSAWNTVDFGYQAPRAGQFLESERALASLGAPRGADAPQPIRVAAVGEAGDAAQFSAMVNPLTGKPAAQTQDEETTVDADLDKLVRADTREAMDRNRSRGNGGGNALRIALGAPASGGQRAGTAQVLSGQAR